MDVFVKYNQSIFWTLLLWSHSEATSQQRKGIFKYWSSRWNA